MLRIIIDAGVIYFLAIFVGLITFALKSNAQFVILDMVSYYVSLAVGITSLKCSFDRQIVPIISITFYMVIVRVGLVDRANQSMDFHARRYLSSTNGSTSRNRMQVHITTLTENRVDDGPGLPSGPVTGVDHKDRRNWNEAEFDNGREVV